MARTFAKPTSVGSFVKTFAVVAVVVLTIGAALNWPAVSAAHTGLTRLYGAGKVHITSMKVIRFSWACGLYSLPPGREQWRFVETRSGFWAQEKSDAWLHDGARSEGGRRWADCMIYSRRGHNNRNVNAAEDWLTSALAGALG